MTQKVKIATVRHIGKSSALKAGVVKLDDETIAALTELNKKRDELNEELGRLEVEYQQVKMNRIQRLDSNRRQFDGIVQKGTLKQGVNLAKENIIWDLDFKNWTATRRPAPEKQPAEVVQIADGQPVVPAPVDEFPPETTLLKSERESLEEVATKIPLPDSSVAGANAFRQAVIDTVLFELGLKVKPAPGDAVPTEELTRGNLPPAAS